LGAIRLRHGRKHVKNKKTAYPLALKTESRKSMEPITENHD